MGRRKTDFTIRDCTHGGRHRHGTATAYKTDNCRCAPCTASKAVEASTRRRQIAYGTWAPFVDADPVRTHVRSLMDGGLTLQAIIERAGVADQVVRRLMYTILPRQKPTARMRADNADALMGVTPADGKPTFAAACGVERRLQALIANGWSQAELGRRVGMTVQQVHQIATGGRTKVRHQTAARISAVYDQLWATPGGSARARRIAEAHGWALPIEWDDDLIDSPAARPHTSYRRTA